MSHSPRVIGQADAALSRVIAETSKTPSASQYWERKRPLYRQLAIRVVEAMHEGLSKEPAVARSILELRSEVLQRAATDSARQAYREWFDRRGVFLSGVAKRLWEAATMVNFPQQSIQPEGNIGRVSDAVRSYKVEINAHGGWSANQRRYATPEEADAAGKDLYSRWTAAEDYRVVPSSDPPNVEPVINVKPAEEKPGSDSRILFMHVGDAPKPAQAPKAKAALDYTPQAFPGAKAPDGPAPDLHDALSQILLKDGQPPVEKPQAAVTEQRVLRYSLHINGLWGKKRTPDFQSVTLASRVDPRQPWPLDRLLTMMRNKVAELRVKPGARLKLVETDVTITPDGFERITLLTDRTLHTETLS